MQQTLLVTVQGTRQRLDIEVPSTVLIDDLIPLLQEMCNHPARFATSAGLSRTSWTLQVAHLAQPLKTTQTLSDAGVLDGDVLLLQARNASQSKSQEKRPAQSIEASAQTGMIGVEWERSWPL